MNYIFHITTETDWSEARSAGEYAVDTLASEGFIHCSTSKQVVTVANQRFLGREDLVLLCIDRQKVEAEIRTENLDGGDSLFPHIYGPLNLDAVMQVVPFPPAADGCFVLPRQAELHGG